MAPVFKSWLEALEKLNGEYTDDQLPTVADFMHKAAERQLEATERLTVPGA